MNTDDNQYINNPFTEDAVDYKGILIKYTKHWYVFVISLFFCITIAFIFNKYDTPIYNTSTSILIKADAASMNSLFPDYSFSSHDQNFSNELIILNSLSLYRKVISEIDYKVSCFVEKKVFSYELYQNSPIKITIDSLTSEFLPVNIRFDYNILSNTKINIISTSKNFNYNDTIYFGDEIILNGCKLKIVLIDHLTAIAYQEKENQLYFIFNNLNSSAIKFRNQIKISPVSEESSAITISHSGTNIYKIVDYLNAFTKIYSENNLKKKNIIAYNTIDFINGQLNEISNELENTEQELQEFLSSHRIMEISDETKYLFNQLYELESEKAQAIIQSKYHDYLKKSIEQNINIREIIAPSTMGINDPLLNKLTKELSDLYSEKSEISYNINDKKTNPILEILEYKIQRTKETILKSISNIMNTNELTINDINSRTNTLSTKIRELPKNERLLLKIKRKFKLTDDIYTFLQEKKAESQISLASNLSDCEIIDKASVFQTYPVSPKKQKNYIIALAFGLFIPIALIYIRDLLNDKITERKDISNITSIPILGQIIHNYSNSNIAIADSPKSIVAESFRTIRTNLHLSSGEKNKQIIQITSSITGEGKTFCAINLSIIFAFFGKKTLLIGFDLRRPGIYKDFNISNDIGITSFLTEKCSMKEIVQKSHIENLDIVTAGPIPANPAELIAMPKTKQMILDFQKDYDYIIIDTSPVGLVSDALQLMNLCDANIYVARLNYTMKKIFSLNINEIKKNHNHNMHILVNDAYLTHSNYYGYKYSKKYSYGYGYGYFSDHTEDDKISFIDNLRQRIKN